MKMFDASAYYQISDAIDAGYRLDEQHSFRPKKGAFGYMCCPICGNSYGHVSNARDLSPEEINTKYGGSIIEFDFECECPRTALVFADHKGTCGFTWVVRQPEWAAL